MKNETRLLLLMKSLGLDSAKYKLIPNIFSDLFLLLKDKPNIENKTKRTMK